VLDAWVEEVNRGSWSTQLNARMTATIFGSGPYLKVPIQGYWGREEETVHRVYPPKRLRIRLAKQFQPTTPEEP